MHTDTNYFCMKEYSALNTRNYTLQVIKSNNFEVSTHVPTYNKLCMQIVGSVTFVPFLKIHNSQEENLPNRVEPFKKTCI